MVIDRHGDLMALIELNNSTQIARMSPVREFRSAILTHYKKRREVRNRREITADIIIDLWNFINKSKFKQNSGIYKVSSLFFNDEFVVVFDFEV